MALTDGVNSATPTIRLDSLAGLPAQSPYTLVLDPGLANEEIVSVTLVSGSALTVTRGYDGSVATNHTVGARVRHMATAQDFRDIQEHVVKPFGVHGVISNVVGVSDAQSLSSKTIDGSSNILLNVPQSAVVGLTDTLAAQGQATTTEASTRALAVTSLTTQVTNEVSTRTTQASVAAATVTAVAGRLTTIENKRLMKMIGVGEAVTAGTVMTLNNEPVFQAGTIVVTSDNLGYVRFYFPTAFPNGVLTVVICGGDAISNPGVVFAPGWENVPGPVYSKSNFVYQVRTGAAPGGTSGSFLPNYLHRVNWIAIGW